MSKNCRSGESRDVNDIKNRGFRRSYGLLARRGFSQRPFAAALPAAAFLFLALTLHATWIPLKAELAQWLIAWSWDQAQNGSAAPAPWPWADTRPVAVLEVPGKGIRQFVLAGNSGRNLAFGPVFTDGTLQGRDRVINGHRDTHFDFLKQLETGERVRLETRDEIQWYEISQTDVVDSRAWELLIDPGRERLSLVTCFPFDRADAGGPLRFVVTALPVSDPGA